MKKVTTSYAKMLGKAFLLGTVLLGATGNTYAQSSVISTNGLKFNAGDDDKVVIDHVSDYNLGTGDFTVEAWVNLDSIQEDFPALFSNRTGHNDGVLLAFYDGKPYSRLTNANFFPSSAANIFDNECHHVAWVKSGTTMEYFIDGVSIGTNSVGTRNVNTSHDLWIGHDFNTGSTALNGDVKEVRLWESARTESELVDNANISLSGSESDLIGYWRFDEGSGQTVADYSATNNDGVLGTTTSVQAIDPSWTTNACYTEAVSGEGLIFDKDDRDKVTIDNVYSIGTGDFTVEAWVNLDATQNSYPALFSNRTGHNDGVLLAFHNGKPYARLTTMNYFPSGGSSIYDGECHHVAWVRSGTTMEYFVDGVSIGTHNVGTRNINTSHDVWIGHDYSASNTAINGGIREVRLWDVARTSGELNGNMDVQLSGTESDLLGYWKFDDASGQTVTDYSTTANDGVLGTTASVQTNDPVWDTLSCDSEAKQGVTGGLSEEGSLEVSVYPNPFADAFVVKQGASIDEEVLVRVFTTEGVLVADQMLTGAEILELGQEWNPGVYLVKFTSSQGEKTLKVIKH